MSLNKGALGAFEGVHIMVTAAANSAVLHQSKPTCSSAMHFSVWGRSPLIEPTKAPPPSGRLPDRQKRLLTSPQYALSGVGKAFKAPKSPYSLGAL